jgi:predicted nucleic acid-binding protein
LIFIDTSALVDSLAGQRHSGTKLIGFLRAGEQLAISSLVLYEWLRGRRTRQELLQQENTFPREQAVGFGVAEAARAAELYKRVPRARTREVDLAIAATAIVHDAALWTLNPEDFSDIPDLQLV